MNKGLRKGLSWPLFLCLFVLILSACHLNRGTPAARHGAKMIYDPVDKQVILFGGRGEGGLAGDLYNDLWTMDLETLRWQKIKTSSGPSPRLSPGMVYDLSRHQIILFGGYCSQGRVNDTWVFDLAELEWEEVTPDLSPPARSDMGMSYNEQGQIILLFGGYCLESQRGRCNDTWIFDPDQRSWKEVTPSSSPPIMYGHSLDYASDLDQFLLWGGHMTEYVDGMYSSAGYNDSIWSFSISDLVWKEISPGSQSHPSARYWHQAAYDSERSGLIVFGGDSGYRYMADTWLYDPEEELWDRRHSAVYPPSRIVGSAVYCPDYGQMILFGGLDQDFSNLNDAWIFSGISGKWEQISP